MVYSALAIVALFLLVPLVSLLLLVALEWRRPRIICLMYHRLAPREAYEHLTGVERIYTVQADAFESQIAHLKNAGYTFVTPDQVRQFVTGELQLPDKSVLITFDDGCLSVDKIARPILQRYTACGTMFVTTDPNSFVFADAGPSERRMTDDELRAADGVSMQFESHCVTHRPLRGLPDDEIRQELSGSKQELERILSREVNYLAIPGNWFDRKVMQIARQVGYKAVWCSNTGFTRIGANPYGLPRISVEGTVALPQFIAGLRPSRIAARRGVSMIKRAPGRLLGPRYWEPLAEGIRRCVPGGYLSTRRLVGAGVALIVFILLCVSVSLWLLQKG